MKTELNKHSPVLLNAFDDAEEALRTALECMDGQSMELADIRQCLDDLYECRTHLRPREDGGVEMAHDANPPNDPSSAMAATKRPD